MNVKEEEMREFFPPENQPLLPIVITNQVYEKGAIKKILLKCIDRKNLDTLIAVAPFISTYFVKMLMKTSVKKLILIINRKDLNPNYLNNAVKMLHNVTFDVEVRERPAKSTFIHLKLLVPYIAIERVKGSNSNKRVVKKLVPYCAISGSVNFTRNGISVSDEALNIFKDPYSINTYLKTYDELLHGTKVRYNSTSAISRQRSRIDGLGDG